MLAITIKPTAMETMSSNRVNPRSNFCLDLHVFHQLALAIRRNQCVNECKLRATGDPPVK